MSYSVRVNLLDTGDTILIYSGRRRGHVEARITGRLVIGGNVHLTTTRGQFVLPATAMVESPAPLAGTN